jgi:hypothetical protein
MKYYYSVGNCAGAYRIICEVDRQKMYYHFKPFYDRNSALVAVMKLVKADKKPDLNKHWTFLNQTTA